MLIFIQARERDKPMGKKLWDAYLYLREREISLIIFLALFFLGF